MHPDADPDPDPDRDLDAWVVTQVLLLALLSPQVCFASLHFILHASADGLSASALHVHLTALRTAPSPLDRQPFIYSETKYAHDGAATA